MRAQVHTVLEAMYASWAVKDLEAVLACCADDILFILHVPTEVVAFAGETRGKADLAPRLQAILRDFDFLNYRPRLIAEDDDGFHTQIHYHFRHKATGHEIEGTMRHIGRVEGDKIVRLEEFHDTPRVQAFFELLAHSADDARRTFPHIRRNK